jgi:hypothetical protein
MVYRPLRYGLAAVTTHRRAGSHCRSAPASLVSGRLAAAVRLAQPCLTSAETGSRRADLADQRGWAKELGDDSEVGTVANRAGRNSSLRHDRAGRC